MGDFDRVQQPGEKKSETKKVLMVVVLGAVLLGLLGFQMVKKGPEQAAASPAQTDAPAATATPGLDEPTANLRAALMVDPTSSYLKNTGSNRFPTATLRDPFQMSRALYDSVKPKAAPPPVEQHPATAPGTAPAPYIPPPPKGVRAADYKLNTILVSNGSLTAMINGILVHTGSTIGDAYIVEVRSNGVTLRHKDFPDGPTVDLILN